MAKIATDTQTDQTNFNDLTYLTAGGRVYYMMWPYAPWQDLGGHDIRRVALSHRADRRAEVFALGKDGQIYHDWWQKLVAEHGEQPLTRKWSGWSGLGGSDLHGIAVGRAYAGHDHLLNLFAIGGDHRCYGIHQRDKTDSTWGGLGRRRREYCSTNWNVEWCRSRSERLDLLQGVHITKNCRCIE